MPVFIGGAELNVASALAKWKTSVGYCTVLPDHYLSKEIIEEVEERGIETQSILFSGTRIGSYYLPEDADLKHASVIYDRDHSSFSELKTGMLDWEKILNGVSWFHFSAISPALNENVAMVCKEGLEVATRLGITISVDLNYRAKLWQYGKQPIQVMPSLVEYCTIVMGNIWAKEKMLGMKIPENLQEHQQSYLDQSLRSSEELVRQFPKCKQVANTFRFDQEKGIKYYATLFSNNKLVQSKEFETSFIIDKVGSGDTFMAGLIYGNQKKCSDQEIIDFASAAAFNKLFIKGDATSTSVEDIITHTNSYA